MDTPLFCINHITIDLGFVTLLDLHVTDKSEHVC